MANRLFTTGPTCVTISLMRYVDNLAWPLVESDGSDQQHYLIIGTRSVRVSPNFGRVSGLQTYVKYVSPAGCITLEGYDAPRGASADAGEDYGGDGFVPESRCEDAWPPHTPSRGTPRETAQCDKPISADELENIF